MTKKGLFGVKSSSKIAKNSKQNGNERKFFLQLNGLFSAFISVHSKQAFQSLRSFRSLKMNVSFPSFISVHPSPLCCYKWLHVFHHPPPAIKIVKTNVFFFSLWFGLQWSDLGYFYIIKFVFSRQRRWCFSIFGN